MYSEESERAKIFVEFVAMILRCKMYIKLKEEMKKLEKKPNYMTVPAALKELEKIEWCVNWIMYTDWIMQ